MSTEHLLNLTIAHPNSILFTGSVYAVTLPTTEGEITVLANHEPIIIVLKKGIVTVHVTNQGEKQMFEISGGVLEISSNKATVLL